VVLLAALALRARERECAAAGKLARMEIRSATSADWPAVYPFFSAIVADGRTYAYPENLSEADAAAVWLLLDPPDATVVAVDGGRVVGSAHMGPNRPGRGSHVATASFMVDPHHHGRGVGRALGEYTLDWSRATGFRAMQFNAVVETNSGAVHLWKSLGFRIVGTVPEAFRHPDHGFVGLHVMHRFL
jgi:L-amino acid N-acyltransferase YncA